MEIAIALAVVGAYGEIEAGKAQKRQYNLQAQQASIEGERKAIQYQQRSNEVLRRRVGANAALSARAYAGGVDPFSGSPDVVRAANDTAAGREYSRLLEDADAAMRSGAFQATMYQEAGRTAERTSYFRAAAKLGSAAASYSSYTGATQAPAPIEQGRYDSIYSQQGE
jgi:hypothetical protein